MLEARKPMMDERLTFRAFTGTRARIDALVKRSPGDFETDGHIIRAALTKFLRERGV